MYVEDVVGKKTICAQCMNIKRRGRGEIWYDLYCTERKVQKEIGVDPVTGETGYKSKNDLGGEYISEYPEPYCRDVNKGNCPYFK